MERLTNRNDVTAYVNCDNCNQKGNCNIPQSCLESLANRLAIYEDAEEQGRLIVLPCKVGDTVYINTPSGATLCEVVDSITKPELRTRTLGGLRGLDFNFHEFGKSVFLSREEAERALEGMK